MALTPMMLQYLEIKKQYPGTLLFFRLGDFYEMFFDDAKLASKELEITLTGRDAGESEKVPMCGVPFHAADSYLAKLIEKGYKVAICEQVEDAKAAKGLVKREVTRVITPGTVIEGSMLDEKDNNYLVSIFPSENHIVGLAVTDMSTGMFQVTDLVNSGSQSYLLEELDRISPREIIYPDDIEENPALGKLLKGLPAVQSPLPVSYFHTETCTEVLKEHFSLESFNNTNIKNASLCAAGALLQYLRQTQRRKLQHLTDITSYSPDTYMLLDSTARRNLEITKSIRDGNRQGSLLGVLDVTRTAMGGRMLKTWLERPLVKLESINARLDAVQELFESVMLREELSDALKQMYDLERLAARAAYGTANGRDMAALLQSLTKLPQIRQLLEDRWSSLLTDIYNRFDLLEDIRDLLSSALNENPPVSLREGGLIKDGFSTEVDRLRAAARNGKSWLAGLEASEKERTGIKSLKVGFNKVFGYYIEVTRSNLSLVPENYQRRQTLANAERYITPELKEYESTILGAEDRLVELEYTLFTEIRERVAAEVVRLQRTANFISTIDAILSLSQVATRFGYVRPEVNDSGILNIIDSRHPVVEISLGAGGFVPNDCIMDEGNHRFCLITGPNMGGKSTYQRQVALIVLMAQAGSFVPAAKASIGVVDRIFARVGASDDLSSGQSTFMVEMFETKQIIDYASSKSLVIIDELGRGTSNLDGMAIAQAVIEYLHNVIGCKTLFSTHYHELAELEGSLPGLVNYATAVKEKGDEVTFLRKVITAKASKSYGIHCAKLAGLPVSVIERANQLVQQLESHQIAAQEVVAGKSQAAGAAEQLTMFADNYWEQYEKEIKSLELSNMTPIECLNYLYELQKKLSKIKQ